MNPVWLVERKVFPEQVEELRSVVQGKGMTLREVDYWPGKRLPHDISGCSDLPDNACVIFWGTLPLMQQIQIHRTWVPGGWCCLENLDCSAYYPQLESHLLNQPCTILPGVEAIAKAEPLFDRHGPEEVFVRPCGVHKIISGRVVHRDDFWIALAPTRYDPTSKIVIAPVKKIDQEWRLVICDRAVVTASRYLFDGTIEMAGGCPESVTEFAENCLARIEWEPDRLFMMDICESEGSLYILELNSFSCSGFYHCNLDSIVTAAARVAREQWVAAHST